MEVNLIKKAKPPIFPGLAANMAANGHDDEFLAEYLGHSVDYFRRRKNGLVEFDLPDIKKLMKLYDCGFSELFGGSHGVA